MWNSSSSASSCSSRSSLVGLDHLEDGADVLLDGHAAEDRGFLRQVADAEAGAAVHRHAGDVVAVELDGAVVGLDQAGDHVEDRGLAGAVRAEQADRLAARHREAGIVDDRDGRGRICARPWATSQPRPPASGISRDGGASS